MNIAFTLAVTAEEEITEDEPPPEDGVIKNEGAD